MGEARALVAFAARVPRLGSCYGPKVSELRSLLLCLEESAGPIIRN